MTESWRFGRIILPLITPSKGNLNNEQTDSNASLIKVALFYNLIKKMIMNNIFFLKNERRKLPVNPKIHFICSISVKIFARRRYDGLFYFNVSF